MQPAQISQGLQNAEQQRVEQAKSGVKTLRRFVSGSFVATPLPFVELIMTTQNIEIRFYPKHHWPQNESKKNQSFLETPDQEWDYSKSRNFLSMHLCLLFTKRAEVVNIGRSQLSSSMWLPRSI